MNQRVLILAAGRGSRMGATTEQKPKCLTTLSGKTLLDWQLDSFRKAGLSNITVIRGYKAELLKGDFSAIFNPRWADTNMVSTLFCAPFYEGDTIVSYSDIVYKPEHVIALINLKDDISITADNDWYKLWAERFEDPFEDAETFRSRDNILLEIGGKTMEAEEVQAQYMGLLKFSAEGWNIAYNLFKSFPQNKQDKTDMTSLLSALLKSSIKISVAFVNGGWCEVDNYNDLLVYENALKNSSDWHHDWREQKT